ncbi:MAG: hypothetical protein ACJATT_000638 [Myxococcota bacterium]|jgi:hypothetical protein
MPHLRPTVTYQSPDRALLPTPLVQPALLLSDLEERGIIDDIA